MLDCWGLEVEERPSFPQLHKTFDDFLIQQTEHKYPYMEVLSKPYHLDNLEPTENPDPEPTPINLDIEITDVDSDSTTKHSTRLNTNLSRSVSHNVPRNLRIVNSESHNSLSNFGSQDMPHRHSLQDIQAELLRQATWQTQVDSNGELVNTRYVVSPTAPSRNGSRKDLNTQPNQENV